MPAALAQQRVAQPVDEDDDCAARGGQREPRGEAGNGRTDRCRDRRQDVRQLPGERVRGGGQARPARGRPKEAVASESARAKPAAARTASAPSAAAESRTVMSSAASVPV